MRSPLSKCLLGFQIALCGFLAHTAQASDLIELYQQAMANDPTFAAANFSLQAARQLKPEAFAALLPAITASGSGSRIYGRTKYTATPEVDRSFDTDQWALQLTQPVFRFENILAYGESRATIEQALAQFELAQEDLILRLARSYFDVVVAEHHVSAAKAQLTALQEQLKAAQKSYAAGVNSVTDVDDTQARASVSESTLVAAINDVDSARAALEGIIGSAAPPLEILKDTAMLPKPMEELPHWVERAEIDNFQVKAAQSAVHVADFEVDRSRAQRLPSLDLVATYGGNYSSGNITDPANFGSNVRDRQVSLQFSMPIFAGGSINAHVSEARAKRSKALADLEGARRQAQLAAKQAYSAVLSGLSQIRALDDALKAGTNAVKGNQVGYGLGVRINSDVLNAQQQYFTSLQDHEKARYDTLFEGLKLKAAAGELSPEDLRALGKLMAPAPAEGSAFNDVR